MKKLALFFILTTVLVSGLYVLYYYYPRSVSYELAEVIEKPNPEFDRSSYVGFDYVENAEQLEFWMVEFYNKPSCIKKGLKGYDIYLVETLANKFDFTKYSYLITYQKELKALRHSPYLTKTEDGLCCEERTPLIPAWDSVQTDKVYIYRIKKNNKFRSPGP